jgi:hypothetical protein
MLVLGSDAFVSFQSALQALLDEVRAAEALSRSTDFPRTP